MDLGYTIGTETGRDQLRNALVLTAYFSAAHPRWSRLPARPVGARIADGSCYSGGAQPVS